jgi:hypothetical protein
MRKKEIESYAYAPKVMGREFFEQPATCSRSSITVRNGPGGII